MKKVLILTACIGILAAPLCASMQEIEVEECVPCIHGSYNYWTIGLGSLPLPGLDLGFGRRIAREENSAIEMGLNLNSSILQNSLRFKVNGLRYFKQTPSSQYYFGLGGSVGVMHINYFIWAEFISFATPNVLLGKEFFNYRGKKRFFQLEAMWPLLEWEGFNVFYCIPLVTVSYGFCF